MNPNVIAMRLILAGDDDTARAAAHDDATDIYPAVVDALCGILRLAAPHLADPVAGAAMRQLILGFAREENQ